MLPLCADEGIGVIPWSPLARGRLTRDWDEQTERSGTDEFGKRLYHDEDRTIVRRVAEIAAKRSASRAQVALSWLLSQTTVVSPIIGVTRPEQLSDLLGALSLDLSSEELEQLEEPYEPHRIAGH